jgi:hypothetical protein
MYEFAPQVWGRWKSIEKDETISYFLFCRIIGCIGQYIFPAD